MIKQLRIIVILVCVMAVLGGGLLFATKSSLFHKTASSAASGNQIKLISTDQDNIEKAVITNKTGTYTIVRTGAKAWTINELKSAPIMAGTIGYACEDLAGLSASSIIEANASDLNKYGLQSPQATIDVTIRGKGEEVFLIGSKSPLGTGYYMMQKGSSTVYLSSTDLETHLLADVLTYIDTALFSVDQDKEAPIISRFGFGGSKRSQAFEIINKQGLGSVASSTTTSGGNIYIVNPRLVVDGSKLNTIDENLTNFFANNAVSIDLSRASLAKYGLDNPFYTFSYTLKNKTTTLNLGKTFKDGDTEYIYARLEGKNAIYRLQTAYIPFYKWEIKDFASPMQFITSLDDLKSLTIQTTDKTMDFEFTGTGDSMQVSCNGKKLNMDYFRDYYQRILNNLSMTGFQKMPTDAKLYLKITCKYQNGTTPSDVMEFYNLDSQRYYWKLNNTTNMVVLKLDVDKAISQAESVINGHDVVTD